MRYTMLKTNTFEQTEIFRMLERDVYCTHRKTPLQSQAKS